MNLGKLIRVLVPIVPILSSQAFAQQKTFNVGLALRLNDKFNGTVAAISSGVETAKSLYEEEHPNVKITLKQFSHNEDLASVVQATEQIKAANLPAVIGGELSEESIVLGDELGPKKIVFITPTSSNPKVTDNKPFVFRACFSDTQVADSLAQFVRTHLKPKAIGVIHNLSSPYTDYLSARFIESYTKEPKNQGIPLFEQKVLRGNVDFRNQIQSFIDHHVTHVILLTHEEDMLRFVVQASEKNFNPIYVGSDGWGTNEKLHNLVVSSAPGSRFVGFRNNYWKEDADSPITARFRKRFEKLFGTKPNAWNAISFDAAWVLFKAMDLAKDPSRGDEVRKAMLKLKKLNLTTTGDFSFGVDHSPKKDLYIYKISQDGIQYEATLK